jgi:hypothetical protein
LREGTSVDRDEVVALPRSVDAAEAANWSIVTLVSALAFILFDGASEGVCLGF